MADPDTTMLPGGQLSLLPDDVADSVLLQSEVARGICSGVQLKGTDPERYQTIVALLADGSLSQRQIAALTRSSRNLVAGINRTQRADIEPLKQQMAARARNLGQLCLERAEEIIQSGADVGLRDLAILAGVAIDKSLLLAGEATQRIEVIDSSSGADEFERQFRQLQQADVQEMGSGAEIGRANGAPCCGPDGDGGDLGDGREAGAAMDRGPDPYGEEGEP